MSKAKKYAIALFCLLASASAIPSFSPAVAHANSAPKIWSGGAMADTLFTSDCPIAVAHETLVFDVAEYPNNFYRDEAEFLSYDGKVTAEYTFFNPEDYDITATLMFPFGTKPEYAYIYSEDGAYISDDRISQKYDITLDGHAVEKRIRHSYFPGNVISNFNTRSQLGIMSDGYIEHEFYSPDMTVTEYTYKPEGIVPTQNSSPYAAFKLDVDASKTRVATQWGNGSDLIDDYRYFGYFIDYSGANKIYAIGEPFPEPLQWSVFEDGSCKRKIDGSMILTATETMTLEQFILGTYDENRSVSVTDYYNACIASLDRAKYEDCAYVGGIPEPDELDFMCWYEYEITVPAGSHAVNTVTAPMYPTIDGDYNPNVYGYTYYLSPAENWAAFGTLDIIVNTPDYMVQSTLAEFTRGDGCYTASYTSLPVIDLTFHLCAEDIEYPSRAGEIILTVLIVVAALIFISPVVGVCIVLIAYAVQQKKRKATPKQ